MTVTEPRTARGRSWRALCVALAALSVASCGGEQETSTSHYPTGTLWSVRRYAGDVPIDPWIVWWPNARTRHDTTYRDGRREGTWTTFAETGQLVLERTYTDDELDGSWRRWLPDGTLVEQGAFERGRRVGVWRRFDVDGALLEEVDHGSVAPLHDQGPR